jgi:hypothetical protein
LGPFPYGQYHLFLPTRLLVVSVSSSNISVFLLCERSMNYQIWTLMVAVGFNAAVRYDPVFFFLKTLLL